MDLAEKVNDVIWDKYCDLSQSHKNSWHNIRKDWNRFLEEFDIEVVRASMMFVRAPHVQQRDFFFFDGYFFIHNFCSIHVDSYLKISYEVALKIILIGL